MDRPSTPIDLADLRIEVADLSKDVNQIGRDLYWQNQIIMRQLDDLSRRPSPSAPVLLSPEAWVKAAPLILAVLIPLLAFLATGSVDQAMQAATSLPR